MKLLLVLSTILVLAIAKPSGLAAISGIPTVSILPSAIYNPPIHTQFHAQDALGQYSYGYNDGHSAKKEVKLLGGATLGAYSYVDAEGKLQTVDYTADANGFHVSATNLPKSEQILPQPVKDTAEVAKARQEHLMALEEAKNGASEAIVMELPQNIQDLPKPVEDTPEVAKAKAEHFAAKKEAELRNSLAEREIHITPSLHTIAAPIVPVIQPTLKAIQHPVFVYNVKSAPLVLNAPYVKTHLLY